MAALTKWMQQYKKRWENVFTINSLLRFLNNFRCKKNSTIYPLVFLCKNFISKAVQMTRFYWNLHTVYHGICKSIFLKVCQYCLGFKRLRLDKNSEDIWRNSGVFHEMPKTSKFMLRLFRGAAKRSRIG